MEEIKKIARDRVQTDLQYWSFEFAKKEYQKNFERKKIEVLRESETWDYVRLLQELEVLKFRHLKLEVLEEFNPANNQKRANENV